MASSGPKRLVPPRPPADFASIALEPGTVGQTVWYRVSRAKHRSPLFFSRHGLFRFDSETAKWGVCYVAQDIATGFMEIFSDRVRAGRIHFEDMDEQRVWKISLPTGLKLLELAGPTLTKMKATLQCFVSRYTLSQEWGRAMMAHSADMDGVVYTGRQSGRSCVALFGDTEPARGRPYQGAVSVENLGTLTHWDGFYPLLAKTGTRVMNLPVRSPAKTWAR